MKLFFTASAVHAVYRTQQGRQREPSVKTLRSPLSTKFWRHCVLSGRTQRRALPRHQSEEMEIFHLLEWGSNPQPVGFAVTLRAPAPRLASET